VNILGAKAGRRLEFPFSRETTPEVLKSPAAVVSTSPTGVAPAAMSRARAQMPATFSRGGRIILHL
jgi:hypothetical protein